MALTRSSDTLLPNVSETGLGFAYLGAVYVWGGADIPKTTVFGTPSDGSHLLKRSENTLGPAH
jgi:hypothetical protein